MLRVWCFCVFDGFSLGLGIGCGRGVYLVASGWFLCVWVLCVFCLFVFMFRGYDVAMLRAGSAGEVLDDVALTLVSVVSWIEH